MADSGERLSIFNDIFPNRLVFLGLAAVAILIVFPYYYIEEPYPALNQWFADQRWHTCDGEDEHCQQETEVENWHIHVRTPRHGADFIAVPLEVTLTNTMTQTQGAEVSVRLCKEMDDDCAPGQTDVRITLDGVEKDTVILPAVPSGSKVLTVFQVRLPRGKEEKDEKDKNNCFVVNNPDDTSEVELPNNKGIGGDCYRVRVLLDGKLLNSITIPMEFNSNEVFKLWVTEYLLSPPGSSILLPLVILLFFGLSEKMFEWGLPFCRRFNEWAQMWRKNQNRFQLKLVVFFLLIIIIGVGALWSLMDGYNSRLPDPLSTPLIWGLIIGAGIYLLFFVLGMLWGALQPKKPGEAEGSNAGDDTSPESEDSGEPEAETRGVSSIPNYDSTEKCQQFLTRLNDIPTERLDEAVQYIGTLLNEYALLLKKIQRGMLIRKITSFIRRNEESARVRCANEALMSAKSLEEFRETVQKEKEQEVKVQNRLLRLSFRKTREREIDEVYIAIETYEAILNDVNQKIISFDDNPKVVDKRLQELHRTLREKVKKRAGRFSYLHRHFAADITDVDSMLEVMSELEKIARQNPEELVTFYAYKKLEETDRGIMPVHEALKVAQGRLRDHLPNVLKDHNPYKARRVLESLDRYRKHIEDSLLSIPDDLQGQIQTLKEKIESELLAYENARHLIARALSVVEDDPLQALDLWEEADKEYFWLASRETDKKERLYKHCEKWIEKHLQKAESADEGASAQFYLDAVGHLLERDAGKNGTGRLKTKYWDKYSALLRAYEVVDEDHEEE